MLPISLLEFSNENSAHYVARKKLLDLRKKKFFFAFVENLHLFQFTASGLFGLFQKLIFQI